MIWTLPQCIKNMSLYLIPGLEKIQWHRTEQSTHCAVWHGGIYKESQMTMRGWGRWHLGSFATKMDVQLSSLKLGVINYSDHNKKGAKIDLQLSSLGSIYSAPSLYPRDISRKIMDQMEKQPPMFNNEKIARPWTEKGPIKLFWTEILLQKILVFITIIRSLSSSSSPHCHPCLSWACQACHPVVIRVPPSGD